MCTTESTPAVEPILSVIIPVYNDWNLLDRCLASLAEQNQSQLEVIVVDDGSRESCPEYVRQWGDRLVLKIFRQEHKGISAARNKGVRASTGYLLLFIDADSRIQANCLSELRAAVRRFSKESFLQLRLIGDPSVITGRAEQLRLTALQEHFLQSDGRIRYVNTAGFAVRRSSLDAQTHLFNPNAPRGEDTILLANLIRRGELPLFLPKATVQHAVPRSVLKCFRKDVSSAYLQTPAYRLIAASGVTVRMSNRERVRMLITMWRLSKSYSGGKTAWLVLLARQFLERTTSLLCRWFRVPPKIRDARRRDRAT
jgi:glycosyltransferase involved in cell wall biosynthesis